MHLAPVRYCGGPERPLMTTETTLSTVATMLRIWPRPVLARETEIVAQCTENDARKLYRDALQNEDPNPSADHAEQAHYPSHHRS
jgi:hypothetical protein